MYKGFIFDFNGTVFWDTHLHNEAWDLFLSRYGIHLTAEEKHQKLHGKNNRQLIHDLFDDELSENEILEIARNKELIYQELVKRDNLQLANGVIELFNILKQKQIGYTIVTASDELNVNFFIEYLELDRWFDVEKIVYADGKQKPKPFPDMFLKAMKLLNIKPSEAIIFEDSETGILAAKRTKPGKIVIVNSNNADYSSWKFEVINSFLDLDLSLLINNKI